MSTESPGPAPGPAGLPRRAGSAMAWQGGQLVGVKLIYLGRIVVLGRLLAPEDFGLFAVALVALDFLLNATDFGMVPALVQRPDPTREHYQAAWTVNMVRALAVAVGLFLLAPWVADLFGEPRATPLLRVLALRPVLDATASIGVARLRKELRFRSLAALKLTEASVNAVVSIALVGALGVWALVAGPLAAAAAFAVLSYLLAPVMPRLRLRGAEVSQLASYGRWILVTAWAALAGHTLLQLGISRQLGAAALGVYFMAGKLAFLPAEVSSQVVGAVAFPVFARVQQDEERGRRVFRAALLGLTALTVPASLLIVVLAPSLALDVLGDQWEPAVPVIRVLALVNIVGILGDVAVPLLEGKGRPDRSAWMNVAQYVLLVVAAWFLAAPYGVAGAAAAWLPAVLVSQVIGAAYVMDALPRPFEKLGLPMAGILTCSLLGAAVALLVDMAVGGFPGPIAAGLAGALVTLGALGYVDRRFDVGLGATGARLYPRAAPLLRRLGLATDPGGEVADDA